MAHLTPNHLESLLKKLQNENLRSPFLNSFPGRSLAKFDLANLEEIKEGLSQVLLEKLLTKDSFSLKLGHARNDDSYEDSKANYYKDRLKKLYLRGQDFEKEKGLKVIYIGFPLLKRSLRADSDRKVLAPLFLWEVSLTHNKNYSDWFIKREKDAEIKLNTSLQLFQQTEGEPNIMDLPDGYLEDNLLDSEELGKYLAKLNELDNFLSVSPDFTQNSLQEGLELLPETRNDLFNEKQPHPKYEVLNSGVIGIFSNSKEAIITDLNTYKEKGTFDLPAEQVDSQKFGAVPLDPSQIETLSVLPENKNLVVHGPPGTGKSQVLTGIISATVAKKQKVIVVCEKITALDVIRNNLQNLGYKEQIALITDVTRDRKGIVLKVRGMAENNYNNNFASITAIEENRFLDDFQKLERKHEKHVKAIQESVLFDYKWTDLVGAYLNLKEAKDLSIPVSILKSWADRDISVFDDIDDLEGILDKVTQHQLFHNYLTNVHDIDPIPLMGEINEVLEFLATFREELNSFEEKVKYELGQKISREIINLNDHLIPFQEKFSRWSEVPFKEQKLIASNQNFKKWLLRLFNSNLKIQEQLYLELKDSRNSLFNALNRSKVVHILKKSHFTPSQVQQLIQKLDRIQKETEKSHTQKWEYAKIYLPEKENDLQKLQSRYFAFSEKCRFLRPQAVNKQLGNLVQIEQELNNLKDTLNQASNYQQFFTLLEDLGVKYNSSAFSNLLNTAEWGKAAKKTLFYWAITNADSKSILDNEKCLIDLSKKESEYQKMVLKKMIYESSIRKESALSSIENKRGIKKVFNLRGVRGQKRNSLKKIMDKFRDEFTKVFPIILTTPEVASTLFRGVEKYFDLVIFDEASQINLEDAIASMIKGRSIVVAGDEHQMPPSNLFARNNNYEDEEEDPDDFDNTIQSESLLNYAQNNEKTFHSKYLDFHYRSEHPALINFSNAAFYGRLLPIPPKNHYTPMEYVFVGGKYENNTNEKEAEKVVELLEKLGSNAKEIPAVGIATLNLKQRNLIFDFLSKKASKSQQFSDLLAKYVEKGLFIKNLENIQGDERDVIIISTTFGKTPTGKFRQNFGPITRSIGHRLLNVLITRAKKKVFVLNSIPRENIDLYRTVIESKGKNEGNGVFYAYLKYVKAISRNDTIEAQSILNLLSKYNPNNITERHRGLLESPFEESVYEVLLKYFGEKEILIQEEDGAFRIDMVIRPNKVPGLKIALECDGATYHSSYESYHLDLHRQKVLEKAGYKFIRIWSKNWYLNQGQEETTLISKIQAIVNDYVTDIQGLPKICERIYEPVIQSEQIEIKYSSQKEAIKKPKGKSVGYGTKVKLKELTRGKDFLFKISERNDLNKQLLGLNSPLGKLLIGKSEGEKVKINEFEYLVEEIETPDL